MISINDAQTKIGKCIKAVAKSRPTCEEKVLLKDSIGRVTANAIAAEFSVPLFDNSAMDGFALRSIETSKATEGNPVKLKITGVNKAGSPPHNLTEPNSCIKIMTGASIPTGTDAVVMKEDVIESGGYIRLVAPVTSGLNIRRQGEDIEQGDIALQKGKRLTPAIVSFLSSIGVKEVSVVVPPRISLLITGHELASDKNQLKPGMILENNSTFLESFFRRENIPINRTEILDDSKESIRSAVRNALNDSDVVVITGGVSVGDYDYTRIILQEEGVEELFWKVAQKPGKPMCAGVKDSTLVFGLPGNPYAVIVCTYLYVWPSILGLMGLEQTGLKKIILSLDKDVKMGGRDQFLKANLVNRNGETCVKLLKGQGSHQLKSLIEAECIIRIPAGDEKLKQGQKVEAYLLP